MNREQLDERHTTVLLRHSRALTDADGRPNALLLAELAAVADEHASDHRPAKRTATDSVDDQTSDQTTDRPANARRSRTAR